VGPGGRQMREDFATPAYVAGRVAEAFATTTFLWRRLWQLDPAQAAVQARCMAALLHAWARRGPGAPSG
jgi:hypothetical protein